MWHVTSRSGVATCELLYTCYLLTYYVADKGIVKLASHWPRVTDFSGFPPTEMDMCIRLHFCIDGNGDSVEIEQ